MRISLALTVAVAAPVLMLTACAADSAEPVRGTVIDKEHEPAKYDRRTVDVTKERTRNKKGVRSCTSVKVGTKKVRSLVKAECYELDILTKDDGVVQICDEDAYKALDVKDRYSSKQDYTKAAR
jgi:hypothetical protein